MTSDRDKAEEIIGKSIDDFISRKKRSGSSWRDISSDLFIATAGVVDVSVSTLKHWSNTPKRVLTPE